MAKAATGQRPDRADPVEAVEAAAEELYGLPPESFTARRGELAQQARSTGDRSAAAEIAKLRKPTVPAWLVNLLAREASEDLTALLDLGEQLRAAQAQLLGPRMKELSQRATAAVQALSRRAGGLADAAGQAMTASVDRDVEQTLRAALADPQAELAVSSGRLTRALAYAGFGEVDVTAATATPLRPAERRASTRPAVTGGASTGPAVTGAGRSVARPSATEGPAEQAAVAPSAPAAEARTAPGPSERKLVAGGAKRATAQPPRPDRQADVEARRAQEAAARTAHEDAVREADAAAQAARAAEALVEDLQERLAQARKDAAVAAREEATAHRAEQRAARAAREAAAALRSASKRA